MNTNVYTSYRALIESTVVPHTQFADTSDALEELFLESMTPSKPEGLSLIGPPGVGKTASLADFANKHLRYETPEATIVPVLSFALPANATTKNIYQAALYALRGTLDSGADGTLFFQLIALLKNCGVKTVVIDEAQHLVMHGKEKTLKRAAAGLKTIMDKAKVNMVLTGTPAAQDLLNGSDELARRFSTNIILREWEPDDNDDINDVAGVMKKLLMTPGLNVEFDDLMNAAFVSRLIYGSGGRIAYISKLFAGVVKLAKEDNRNIITQSDFEKVFVKKVWYSSRPKTNPFSEKFEMRKLDRPTEPFWTRS